MKGLKQKWRTNSTELPAWKKSRGPLLRSTVSGPICRTGTEASETRSTEYNIRNYPSSAKPCATRRGGQASAQILGWPSRLRTLPLSAMCPSASSGGQSSPAAASYLVRPRYPPHPQALNALPKRPPVLCHVFMATLATNSLTWTASKLESGFRAMFLSGTWTWISYCHFLSFRNLSVWYRRWISVASWESSFPSQPPLPPLAQNKTGGIPQGYDSVICISLSTLISSPAWRSRAVHRVRHYSIWQNKPELLPSSVGFSFPETNELTEMLLANFVQKFLVF